MNRSTIKTQISRAVLPLLDDDEVLIGSGPAWIAEPRKKIPTALLARKVLGVALTDRRLLVVDPPRRQLANEHDVLLNTHHEACRLLAFRTWTPMQHLRLRRADDRELVLEFRPRDRALGLALADLLPRPRVRPASSAAPATVAATQEDTPSPS